MPLALPATDVHAPILGTRLVRWADEAACAASAAALARRLPPHADLTLELSGPLGAGKTTFVRHLLRSLGVQGRVKSPTYAVVETYSLPALEVAHFDFYRFADAREWEDAGLRDLYAGPGLKVAEWPEHAAPLLPCPDLRLTLAPTGGRDGASDHTGDGNRDDLRDVRFDALSPRGLALLP